MVVSPLQRCHFNEVFIGIKAAEPQVCFQHVLIAGKCFCLAKNFCAFAGRFIKTYQHQVQVHGQLVHHHHFVRQGTDNFC